MTAEFSVPRRCATADTLHPRRSMAWGHGQGLTQEHGGVHDVILVPCDPKT